MLFHLLLSDSIPDTSNQHGTHCDTPFSLSFSYICAGKSAVAPVEKQRGQDVDCTSKVLWLEQRRKIVVPTGRKGVGSHVEVEVPRLVLVMAGFSK